MSADYAWPEQYRTPEGYRWPALYATPDRWAWPGSAGESAPTGLGYASDYTSGY